MLRPVRLKLEVPLEGPYTRLLRRPAPEVTALGQGICLTILRASRIREPAPLLPASVASYYGQRGRHRGLDPEDFGDPGMAVDSLEQIRVNIELRFLAVPVGHVSLPNEEWISRLAERVTPWRKEVIETWRMRIERNLWLNVMRMYVFEPIVLDSPGPAGLQPRVKPFRAENLHPIHSDGDFARALDEVLGTIEILQMRKTSRFSEHRTVSNTEKESPVQPPYHLAQMVQETGFDQLRLMEWETRLLRKKQMILYGPPGTGKTFVAERLARRLVGGARGFSELLQFHPGYAYEDFVQGIRPRTRMGAVEYEMEPGRFLAFCARAERVPDSPCVLIIDEINRAPLAKVFGELMYLLEYRNRSIPLAGGGDAFRIPGNVFLIGTMNTADRSIALVDQALRRRFTFVRLQAEIEILRGFLKNKGYPADPLVAVVEDINRQIGDPDHELGISFFMAPDDDLGSSLPHIWEGEIEPYLEEVFYDQLEQMKSFRWRALREGALRDWPPCPADSRPVEDDRSPSVED